jgi:hypothetical protein
MSKDLSANSRRHFIKIGLLSLSSLLLQEATYAQETPKLDENDPAAKGLGYAHDATKVDVAKFPKRAGPDGANQFCHSCQLYTGKAGDEWGPCSIFAGKLVSANGWCNTWVKKVA